MYNVQLTNNIPAPYDLLYFEKLAHKTLAQVHELYVLEKVLNEVFIKYIIFQLVPNLFNIAHKVFYSTHGLLNNQNKLKCTSF